MQPTKMSGQLRRKSSVCIENRDVFIGIKLVGDALTPVVDQNESKLNVFDSDNRNALTPSLDGDVRLCLLFKYTKFLFEKSLA